MRTGERWNGTISDERSRTPRRDDYKDSVRWWKEVAVIDDEDTVMMYDSTISYV